MTHLLDLGETVCHDLAELEAAAHTKVRHHVELWHRGRAGDPARPATRGVPVDTGDYFAIAVWHMHIHASQMVHAGEADGHTHDRAKPAAHLERQRAVEAAAGEVR